MNETVQNLVHPEADIYYLCFFETEFNVSPLLIPNKISVGPSSTSDVTDSCLEEASIGTSNTWLSPEEMSWKFFRIFYPYLYISRRIEHYPNAKIILQ